MRENIRIAFYMIGTVWLLISFIVGIAWLFDSYPENLTWLWKKIGNILAVSFLLNLLFGEKTK